MMRGHDVMTFWIRQHQVQQPYAYIMCVLRCHFASSFFRPEHIMHHSNRQGLAKVPKQRVWRLQRVKPRQHGVGCCKGGPVGCAVVCRVDEGCGAARRRLQCAKPRQHGVGLCKGGPCSIYGCACIYDSGTIYGCASIYSSGSRYCCASIYSSDSRYCCASMISSGSMITC